MMSVSAPPESKKSLNLVLNEPMVNVSSELNPSISPRRQGKSPRRVSRKSGLEDEAISPRRRAHSHTANHSTHEGEADPQSQSKTPHSKKHRHRSAEIIATNPACPNSSEESSPSSSPRSDDSTSSRTKYIIGKPKSRRNTFSGLSSSTEESSESDVDSPSAEHSPEMKPNRRELGRTKEKSKSLEIKPTEEEPPVDTPLRARRFSSNLEALEENVVQEEEGDKELKRKGGRHKSLDYRADDKVIKLGVKVRSPKRQAIRPAAPGTLSSLQKLVSEPQTSSTTIAESEEESSPIVFVGKPDSGKSSIIHRMASGEFGVMDKFSKQPKIIKVPCAPKSGSSYILIQDTIDDNLPQYLIQYTPTCLVLVFSVTSETSLKKLEEYVVHIREFYPDEGPKIIVLGNKIDLERIVPTEQGKAVANKLNAEYMEVSALTGMGIMELLRQLSEISKKTSYPKIEIQVEPVIHAPESFSVTTTLIQTSVSSPIVPIIRSNSAGRTKSLLSITTSSAGKSISAPKLVTTVSKHSSSPASTPSTSTFITTSNSGNTTAAPSIATTENVQISTSNSVDINNEKQEQPEIQPHEQLHEEKNPDVIPRGNSVVELDPISLSDSDSIFSDTHQTDDTEQPLTSPETIQDTTITTPTISTTSTSESSDNICTTGS